MSILHACVAPFCIPSRLAAPLIVLSASGRGFSSAHHASKASSSRTTSDTVENAAEAMEGAAADAVQRLHPAFTTFINSGYLESQRQLRDRLLKGEWDDTVKAWALRNGVAEFEKYVVENGQEKGIAVSWDVLQKLYDNPEDLSPLADNERARLLAQAMITQAVFKQQFEVYKACVDSSKQLANVIESGQRTGVYPLFAALKKFIPIPFLNK